MVELFPTRLGPAPTVKPRVKTILTLKEFIQTIASGISFAVEFFKPSSDDHQIVTARLHHSRNIENFGLVLDLYDLNDLTDKVYEVPIDSLIALRLEGKRFNWNNEEQVFYEE